MLSTNALRGGAPRWRDIPLSILGSSLLFADYNAADVANPYALNQGITIATGVDAWRESYRRNTAPAQATTTRQPTASATSFGGRPGVTFDGSNHLIYTTAMSPTIATGARVYIWLVANFTATPAGNFASAAYVSRGDGQNVMRFGTNSTANNQYGYGRVLSDGSDGTTNEAGTQNTSRHVMELQNPNSTTGVFLVDGTAFNGTRTGTLTSSAVQTISFGGNNVNNGQLCKLCMHRFIIAHNPGSITDLPSSEQITKMRTYLQSLL